ncbi:hypothetical protein EG68_05841 [Paragonimus skrjabini miyazakii]|uniref:Rab GDP dissociation inhibitor n=1 Tax=Paragonimus skrjabini miyazakii TaxID=59628 RepID=A0A8S9YZC1_9TREM|nr:hypothetical protein EG68_05841 [Paragonimus skrjabini miyazakii]
MSIEKKKVLHMDRNKYYGGASTSLSPLEELFEKFGVKANLSKYGRTREWNVDLIPKFLMANGKLVSLLVHTGVTRYLDFQSIAGSYVFHKGKIHKVPSNETEALATSLVGFFEKRRLAHMLKWAVDVEENVPSTWTSVYSPPTDIRKDSITYAFNKFGIDENTQNFVGHALCLFSNDSYKTDVPAIEVIRRMQLYDQSVARFGKSPYVYPLYGLGELPQAFARLSAVYGGTYMLNKPVEEIVMENGKVVGVKAEGEVARCDAVICDPSYVPNRVKKVGQVVRAICILAHPIQNAKDAASLQVIIPQSEVGRRHDIYISCVSNSHQVCPKNFFIALVATTVETPFPQQELQPGLRLLEPIEQVFYSVDDLYEPTDDGRTSRIFISNSYDASTHFESTCANVLSLYEKITGKPFDFSQVTKQLNQDDEDGT